uniref:Uncharacterized protein n=1 Tax=Oryza brachyantha TaxID=4533 RepID=J3LZU9_ORYBR
MTPVAAENPTYAVSGTTGHDRREVDGRGDESTLGLGHADRRHRHVEHRGGAVVVHPHLHRLSADEAQVVEDPRGVVVVAGAVVLHGPHAVDVDADVVAVHVLELWVEHGIELDGEDVVVGLPVVTDVEYAEVLAGVEGGETRAGRDHERHAVVAQDGEVGHDGEDKHGREGLDGAARASPQANRRRVERVSGHLVRAVAEHEEAVGRHGSHAIEREVGAAEAVVGELVDGEHTSMVRANDSEQEEQQEEAVITHRELCSRRCVRL